MTQQAPSSSQPLTRDTVLAGLKSLGTATFLQAIGAVLVVIAAVALLAVLPFYGPASPAIAVVGMAQSVAAGLSWFIVAVIFITIINYSYLLPSATQLTMWKPAELSESSRLMKIGYLAGSILVLIALFVITIINAINDPDIIEDYKLREDLAKGLIWPIIVGVVGSAFFFVGWIGICVFLHELRELFDTPVLSKLGILVLVYGLVFVILKASLLIAYYGYTVAGSSIIFALQPTLLLALLIAILGTVTWTLIYTETASLRKKILSGTLQV